MLQWAKLCASSRRGGEQVWLVLAIKLWYYCWSSYNVIHPIKGDILQNPVLWSTTTYPSMMQNRLLWTAVHLLLYLLTRQLSNVKFSFFFWILKLKGWEHCATLCSDQINNIIVYQEKLCNSCFLLTVYQLLITPEHLVYICQNATRLEAKQGLLGWEYLLAKRL